MASRFVFVAFLSLLLPGCPGSVRPDCEGGTCDDTAPSDATIDRADPDADVTETGDAAASGALGAPCTDDSQCDSGICLSPPIGRCTINCTQRHDCPSGNNWTCSGVPGRGTICDCAMRNATEVGCNGLDDDCDGVTDEHSQDCMGLCTDLWTNNHNCGACGIACTNGSVCRNGMCDCPTDRPDICGTQCVSTQSDPMHCGSCSSPCAMQPNSTPVCLGGACGVYCVAGFGDCNHVVSDGCEVDVRGDPANCGACGMACSFANASATCSTGTCVMGACGAGFANCNGSTLDGCESAVASDVSNCGSCGHACMAPNAMSGCASGACTLLACNAGFANCNGSAADGCEVSLQTDPANCGVCGGTCPARANATPSCAMGVCSFSCGFGFGNCDGNAANGCETSLLADPNNCGACGTACTAGPNQTAMCSSGACQRACSPGFGDCDGNTANGCETDLRTSLSSCGACGAACMRAHATAVCAASACSTGVCATGFGNCDGSDFNGCESSLPSDPLNCGACGNRCPGATSPHTIASCTASSCGFACSAGFANCDGSLANGCEADLGSSATCGSCGTACPSGQACVSGTCTSCSPTSESCNGVDDDCDGIIDDGITRPCSTPCGEGVQTCSAGTFGACVGPSPSPEVCDNRDNDCNGMIDDNLGTIICGIGACQRAVPRCIGGMTQSCIPGSPTAESCNGYDDNCDGSIDEGLTRSCFGCGGPMGTQTCMNGIWGTCSTATPERCDGVDNDCNGMIDENLGTTMCGVGACARVVPMCVMGTMSTCTPGMPTVEMCNGIDDNCNGVVDDGLGFTTCGTGACQRTVPNCASGAMQTCAPGSPLAETCNGVDDNCNGVVDDGISCP